MTTEEDCNTGTTRDAAGDGSVAVASSMVVTRAAPSATNRHAERRDASLLGEAAGEFRLRITAGPHAGRIVQLSAAKCTVGSAPYCTLRLHGAGIDPVQCVILHGRGRSVVRRWSGSTLLNDRTFDDMPLKNGDRLAIGTVEMQVLSLPGALQNAAGAARRFGEELQADRGRLNSLTARLELSNRQGRRRLRAAVAKLRKYQMRMAEMEGRRRLHTEERTQLELERARLEAQDRDVQARLAECERRRQSLAAEEYVLQEQAQRLRELAKQSSRDRQTAQEELERRRSELAAAETRLRKAEAKLNEQHAQAAAEQAQAERDSAELLRWEGQLKEQATTLAQRTAQDAARACELENRERATAQTLAELANRQAELQRSLAEAAKREAAHGAPAALRAEEIEKQEHALAESRRAWEETEKKLSEQSRALTESRQALEVQAAAFTARENDLAAREASLAARAQSLEAQWVARKVELAAFAEAATAATELATPAITDADAETSAELGERSAELERRAVDLEDRVAELDRRSKDLDRRNADLAVQAEELTLQSETLARQFAEAAHCAETAELREQEALVRNEETQRRQEEVTARCEALKQHWHELVERERLLDERAGQTSSPASLETPATATETAIALETAAALEALRDRLAAKEAECAEAQASLKAAQEEMTHLTEVWEAREAEAARRLENAVREQEAAAATTPVGDHALPAAEGDVAGHADEEVAEEADSIEAERLEAGDDAQRTESTYEDEPRAEAAEEEVVETPQAAEKKTGESAADVLRRLGLASVLEDAGQEEPVSRQRVEIRPTTPPPEKAPPAVKAAAATPAGEHAEDESITDYMALLFERLGVQRSDVASAAAGRPESPSRESQRAGTPEPAPKPKAEPVAQAPQQPLEAKDFKARSVAAEKGTDLSALRELANVNARAAVANHQIKTSEKASRWKGKISIGSAVISFAACGVTILGHQEALPVAIGGLAVATVFCFKSLGLRRNAKKTTRSLDDVLQKSEARMRGDAAGGDGQPKA